MMVNSATSWDLKDASGMSWSYSTNKDVHEQGSSHFQEIQKLYENRLVNNKFTRIVTRFKNVIKLNPKCNEIKVH